MTEPLCPECKKPMLPVWSEYGYKVHHWVCTNCENNKQPMLEKVE